MANNDQRDSMVIYRSFYEAIKDLPAQAQAEVWKAVFELGFNFNEIELNGIAKTIFTLIKPNIEANIKRFKNGKEPKQNRSKTEANDKQEQSKMEAKQKQTTSKTEANKDKDVDVDKDVDKEDDLEADQAQKSNLTPWQVLKKFKSIQMADIHARYIYIETEAVGKSWELWFLANRAELAEKRDIKAMWRSFDWYANNANENAMKAKSKKPIQQEGPRARDIMKINQDWD